MARFYNNILIFIRMDVIESVLDELIPDRTRDEVRGFIFPSLHLPPACYSHKVLLVQVDKWLRCI